MFTLLSEFSTTRNGLERYLRRHHFGRMWARDAVKFETPHELMGFDNGAWSAFKAGRVLCGDTFLRRLDQCWRMLERNPYRCIVAAVPDIVEGGLRSLEFSLEWRLRVPEGMPWHLVVQDGMTEADVLPHMDLFSGIFLGGADRFKTTADTWCQFAHQLGKTFHWGRCRSVNNVREARLIGADSIDSHRPVRAWVSGERHRAKKWLRVAMGRDDQPRLFS